MKVVKSQPKLQSNPAKYIFTCISLATIAEVTQSQAQDLISSEAGEKWFDEPLTGKVYLSYPFEAIVEVDIKKANSVGAVLWQIAKAYEQIFAKYTVKKYGESNHGFGDLVAERMFIDKTGLVDFHPGS